MRESERTVSVRVDSANDARPAEPCATTDLVDRIGGRRLHEVEIVPSRERSRAAAATRRAAASASRACEHGMYASTK